MLYTHPLYVWNQKLANGILPTLNQPSQAPSPSQATDPNGSALTLPGQAGDSDIISFSRSKLQAKLSTFERMSTDPNASSYADFMHQMLLSD